MRIARSSTPSITTSAAGEARAEDPAKPASENEAVEPDAVLDVEEVARLLRVGRNTIYDLVGRNAIPHRRLGKHIRFRRAAVVAWLGSWSSRDAKERQ